MTEADFKWLWAAYRMGGLRSVFEGGLDQESFKASLMDILIGAKEWFLLEAGKPVGVVGMLTGGTGVFEPHVRWFPWASPRNRLETSMKFLNALRREGVGLLYINQPDQRLYEQIKRYGLIRQIGVIHDIPEKGGKTIAYQTKSVEVLDG